MRYTRQQGERILDLADELELSWEDIFDIIYWKTGGGFSGCLTTKTAQDLIEFLESVEDIRTVVVTAMEYRCGCNCHIHQCPFPFAEMDDDGEVSK